MTSSSDPRTAALSILARWLEQGTFPDHMLEEVHGGRAWVTEVVFGVVRQLRLLQWLLARHVERAPRPDVEAALLAGLYELYFMRDAAPHAVLHETVERVKVISRNQAGFVNAVLRRALPHRSTWRREAEKAPAAVRWSHPDLLVERWIAHFGEAHTGALCAWNNEPPEVVLRVQTSRVEPPVFRARLRDVDIEAAPHPARPQDCFVLPRGVRIADVPGYAEGWFVVQDPSTLSAVDLLAVRPGERVLDACAAPGGKTLALADRLRGQGEVVACDVDEKRVKVLRENVARGGFSNVEVRAADLGALGAAEPFAAVLLDVPCSNTGVLRRRPDARWRFSLTKLKALVRGQRQLLSAGAALVGSGGRLVYSTCSLEREEDEDQVRGWLNEHPDFAMEKEVRLLPPDARCDGAYAALLRKR